MDTVDEFLYGLTSDAFQGVFLKEEIDDGHYTCRLRLHQSISAG
jgi:hypothetical protein